MIYPELHKQIDDLIWKHLESTEPAIKQLKKENLTLKAELRWIANNLQNLLNWPRDKQELEVIQLKKRAKDVLEKPQALNDKDGV